MVINKLYGPYSYPNDTKFWPDFMSDRKQWGLMTYEQDWARSNSFLYSKIADTCSKENRRKGLIDKRL